MTRADPRPRHLLTVATAWAVLTLAWTLPTARSRAQGPDEQPKQEKQAQPEQADKHATQKALPDPEEFDYLALADAPVFLPRSYLYWGTPVGPKAERQKLVFALEYALHLPFYNDLREKALAGKNWAGAATLSFEGDLRMLATPSKPVRMPSYRPTLSGQVFYIWYRPHPVLFGLRQGFFHYSNGQERCTFDIAAEDETEACTEAFEAVVVPWRSLNRINGDFSMNGWLLQVDARVHQLNARGVAIGHLAFGFLAMGNMDLGPGQMPSELRSLYGWGRLRFSAEARRLYGWSMLDLRAAISGYPDSGHNVPVASAKLEAEIRPFWLAGFGVFIRYYGGRDFYNAFFVDSIQQFALGLSWDGERPLKFAMP